MTTEPNEPEEVPEPQDKEDWHTIELENKQWVDWMELRAAAKDYAESKMRF